MLRRFASIFTIISLVFLSLFFTPQVLATTPADFDVTMEESAFDKNLRDFCNKRSGTQMNLETWYSGKCTDDTFAGEGVGFSDIVILDLAEKLSGKKDPTKTFTTVLKEVFDTLDEQSSTATPNEQRLAIDSAKNELLYKQNNGLISQSGKFLSSLFNNKPASTGSYIAHVSQNLQKHKIIPSALAATPGVGFSTFSPFLTVWMVVRNLAYIALVAFFIVYGFMMMFRVNLGQKTVITVQLAIPKLIVTLLIITFSYAIVGLIYDLMWVVIYFLISYLTSQDIIVNGSLWHPAVTASGNGLSGLIGSLTLNTIVSGPAAIFGVLNLVLGGIGAQVGTIVGYISGINFLIGLFITIAVFISYGKLFFKLIGSFISVVISLITAPLVLLGNAFPGSQIIGTWMRSLVANLSVFPVTMLLLLFSYLLMIQPLLGICKTSENEWRSLLGTNATGQLGVCENIFGVKGLVETNASSITGIPLITPLLGFDANGLLALLGVGLLLMAAKYVDIVKDALKVPPFKYGTAISDALKLGWKTGGMVPSIGESGWYKGASSALNLPGGKPTGKSKPTATTPTTQIN